MNQLQKLNFTTGLPQGPSAMLVGRQWQWALPWEGAAGLSLAWGLCIFISADLRKITIVYTATSTSSAIHVAAASVANALQLDLFLSPLPWTPQKLSFTPLLLCLHLAVLFQRHRIVWQPRQQSLIKTFLNVHAHREGEGERVNENDWEWENRSKSNETKRKPKPKPN